MGMNGETPPGDGARIAERGNGDSGCARLKKKSMVTCQKARPDFREAWIGARVVVKPHKTRRLVIDAPNRSKG
jgi:hypothetical protein